jgi:hypothetical protein
MNFILEFLHLNLTFWRDFAFLKNAARQAFFWRNSVRLQNKKLYLSFWLRLEMKKKKTIWQFLFF